MPQPHFAPPGFNLFRDGSEMPAELKPVAAPCAADDAPVMPAVLAAAASLSAVLH